MTTPPLSHHLVTLSCDDRPGIVHAVTAGLLDAGGNIVENAQFTDPTTNTFCMRLHVEAPTAPSDIETAVAQRLDPIVADRQLTVRLADGRPRTLIMVSKHDHCLVDLLYRWGNDRLPIEIPAIVSNHPDCGPIAERYGIPYMYLPVTPETKAEQEAAVLALIDEFDIDLVVLARYMQVLSDEMCSKLAGRAINIHHSFLPGFKGAKPYHQAFDRGVKIIGATAHFVTADLDEGPIIDQGVTPVTHATTVDRLVELGKDTERIVLARAVRQVAEDRVFIVGSRTVVFD